MINPRWKRIAGIHCQDDGEIAAVWLAHDTEADCIHLYDSCIFQLEVIAVIAEGLNCRGRRVPIAWESRSKDMADKLLDRGCNMLPEAAKDTDTLAEVVSREIWERMRTGRFKVDKRMASWLDEYKTFYRQDSQVPTKGYSMMAATRHAVAQLENARRQQTGVKHTAYPKVAIF